MNELEIFSAQTNITVTIQKLRLSVNDIKEKHPTRLDLINSMELTIEQLTFSQVIFKALEKQYRATRENCYDYALLIGTMRKQVEDLQKQNNELKELL